MPACAQCNNFAGTLWAFDFDARVDHVKSKIREKYKSLINTPDWSEDEIAELGSTLRSKIEPWQNQRKIVLERLAWNAKAYLSRIDHNSYFAHFVAEIDDIIAKGKISSSNSEPPKRGFIDPFLKYRSPNPRPRGRP